MSRLLAGLVTALTLAAPGLAGVQPGAMGDGLEAKRLLGELGNHSSSEEAHAAAAKAQLAFQGTRAGHDEDAVKAGGSRFERLRQEPGAGPGGTPSLHVSEPPPPGGAKDPPPGKPKRDWGKLIMKWLPVAIALFASVQMIVNPVGTATFWVRNLALIAGLGTVQQLIKEIRKK